MSYDPKSPEMRRRRFRPIPVRMLVPNVITLLAICAGLTAIRLSTEGRMELAVAAIVFAAVLDGIDGRVARMIKGQSKFGAELDSLADFVNFGVAPGLILYFWQLHELNNGGWIAAMVFAISGGLRLARFNATMDDPNKPAFAANFFTGVPAPAGAITVLLPIYLAFLGLPRPPATLTALYTLLIAFLMVSRLPVFSGKTVRMRVPPEMVLPVFVSVIFFIALLIGYPWHILSALHGAVPLEPAARDGSRIATMSARPPRRRCAGWRALRRLRRRRWLRGPRTGAGQSARPAELSGRTNRWTSWVRSRCRLYGLTEVRPFEKWPTQKSGENAVTESATAPLPAALLEALARYDTPTICNAMEVVAPERRLIGYTTKPLVCPFPDLPPMVGYARTVTIRSVLKSGSAGRRAGQAPHRILRICRHRPRPAHHASSRISTAPTSAMARSGARSKATCTRRSAASASSPTDRSATSRNGRRVSRRWPARSARRMPGFTPKASAARFASPE